MSSNSNASTIQQTVQFNSVTPERLYEIYLSSVEHTAFTGSPATIDPQVGGLSSIYGGGATGKFLQLEAGRLIVQSWRGRSFQDSVLDTTLVLTFRKNDGGAKIELVQSNVPDAMLSTYNTGWNTNYWEPLKEYLRANAVAAPIVQN